MSNVSFLLVYCSIFAIVVALWHSNRLWYESVMCYIIAFFSHIFKLFDYYIRVWSLSHMWCNCSTSNSSQASNASLLRLAFSLARGDVSAIVNSLLHGECRIVGRLSVIHVHGECRIVGRLSVIHVHGKCKWTDYHIHREWRWTAVSQWWVLLSWLSVHRD